VLPYNHDVVDWNELAVIIPQRRVSETLSILRNISDESRCKMRQKGYNFFKTYVATSEGRLRAILEILQASRENHGLPIFSAVPE
jgi:alpha-1,4-N-acetylglucosaminyltransferase EXTL3